MVWQGDEDKKKIHLLNWKTCYKPRDQGGLGILHLHFLNKALLAKWFQKLETGFGIWQIVLLNNYVSDGCICRAKPKVGDSQF